MARFGEVLRRLRRERKLSQDELGALAGVNGQTISNIETGKVATPQGDSYRRIAKALDLSVEQLNGLWEGGGGEIGLMFVDQKGRRHQAPKALQRRLHENVHEALPELSAWLDSLIGELTPQEQPREAPGTGSSPTPSATPEAGAGGRSLPASAASGGGGRDRGERPAERGRKPAKPRARAKR